MDHPNPYESLREKSSIGKGGLRLATIGVVAMLLLLCVACAALGVVAYLVQGLG